MIIINKKVVYNDYIHIRSYDPKSVLVEVYPNAEPRIVYVDGIEYKVNFKSTRLQCFKKSRKCVVCGRIGNIMSLDRFYAKSDIVSAHFNLYAEDEDGKFILMTQDHIIPRSKGGKNHISNLQTMCSECNNAKGNKTIEELELSNG